MAQHITDPEYVSKNYRVLWANSVIGLAVADAEGKWVDVNPAFCDLVEYTESELRSKTFHDITHPDDSGPHSEMLSAVLNGNRDHYLMSKRYITKTGGIVWISLRVDRIENTDGSFSHFFSQVQPHLKIERNQVTEYTRPPGPIPTNPIGKFVFRYWPQVCTGFFLLAVLTGWVIDIRVQWAKGIEQERRIDKIEELLRMSVEANALNKVTPRSND
jgi:PAS domain S-box-containing protein